MEPDYNKAVGATKFAFDKQIIQLFWGCCFYYKKKSGIKRVVLGYMETWKGIFLEKLF